MYEIQKFGLDKVYCAPSQDRQFTFKLVRVTKKDFPVKRIINVYNVIKQLPDQTSFFHVYVIGNLNPNFLNLIRQGRDWFKDVWVNVNDDMNLRNYILQIYNDDGVIIPRSMIYYSFIDESSLMFAVNINESFKRYFDTNSFNYLRVYSNSYFNSEEYNTLPVKNGIKCELKLVGTNSDKVSLQNKIMNLEQAGGKTLIYVNGYYTDNLNLNIPDNSYIEYLYDQSIISKENFLIKDLRTFDSIKDDKLKYLLFRDKITNRIQYYDDNEIYIATNNELVTKGLFFYQHKDYAIRNVTDKDYSLYTSFINNQASKLSELTYGSLQDKSIVLYTRLSGMKKELIYSSLKLHELYKLPQDTELDVLLNSSISLNELRAETLENSDYFKLASCDQIKDITKELTTSAIGYNGISYYFGYNPISIKNNNSIIDVPYLYQSHSYAYEYDNTGRYINRYVHSGPLYGTSNPNTKYVEFIKGTTSNVRDKLFNQNETITLKEGEYRIISAYYDGVNRISNWEDITDTNLYSKTNNTITLNLDQGKKAKIIYLDDPITYDLEIPLVDGTLYFPLTVEEDRGNGVKLFSLDVPFRNIEVFLNGYRLNYKIDFFLDLPYISICNKTYLDYTRDGIQSIHIRAHGFTIDKNDINKLDITGFVNNGVLTRNNYYDIRDDRVFSVFINGRIYDRELVRYSEDDSTVRLNDPLNGLPYTLTEHFISVKEVTGLDTLPIYKKNLEINDKIASLFNQVFKEPKINEFNVIGDHHYLYSPIVSKIIHDLLDENIPARIYTTPYNDATILDLLETKYKQLFALDPIKADLPDNLIEIHPHPGNTIISLNLHQYRFLTNVIRIITLNKPNKINTSGYIAITTQNVAISDPTQNTPGGVIVI